MRSRAFCTRRLAWFLVGWCAAGLGGAAIAGPPAEESPKRMSGARMVSRSSGSGSADQLEVAAEALFAEGCTRLKGNDAGAAIPLLAQAAAVRPERIEYAARLAEAYLSAGRLDAAEGVLKRLTEGHSRHERLWLAWIDVALGAQRWAAALERTREAGQRLGGSPALDLRAGQAYFGLGQVLGKVAVREIPDGQAGQFVGGWLLVEERGPGRFLCCPEASALYHVRRALDADMNDPVAHVLHALIWQKLGKPEVGFALLKSRESALLEGSGAAALARFAELALRADAPGDYLRYRRMQAEREPQRRAEILGAAYAAVAEYYAHRGEAALYREFCRRALRLEPDDVELTLRLADAEWSADQHGRAGELYRRVLELKPRHAARGRVLERLAVWQAECESSD